MSMFLKNMGPCIEKNKWLVEATEKCPGPSSIVLQDLQGNQRKGLLSNELRSST